MSDDKRTWRKAEAEAQEAAREWVRDEYDGDMDMVSDAAHEYADGDSDVIYTAHARSVWEDSTHVQRYEQEADGWFGPDAFATIDERITATVYLAIRHAFEMEAYDAIENMDDEDEADVEDAEVVA